LTSSTRGLLGNADFLRLWTAETVSVFGTQVTLLALPLVAATTLSVSAFEFGLLSTVELLPFIMLSLPAGVWVDRLRRRPIMIVADLGRAVALASIPVAFAFDSLTIWQLYVVGFVNGCFTVFFDVAYQSYLPSIVERDQLVEGNAKLEITRSAAQILGPGLAGLLIGVLRAPIAIVLDAISFVWSALFLGLIQRPEPPVRLDDESGVRPEPSMRQEIAAGLRYVTGHPWLRSLAATTAIANFFGSLGTSILILYLVRERHLGAETIGLAFSIGSVGVLLAAITTSRLTRMVGVGRMLTLTSIGFSVAALPVPIASEALIVPAVAASGFLFGYSGVAWGINQLSLRQAITPPPMQGRMNATMRFISWGTTPIGAIVGGALGTAIGLHAAIWVGALGGLFAFVPVALSSVRSITTIPVREDDGTAPE